MEEKTWLPFGVENLDDLLLPFCAYGHLWSQCERTQSWCRLNITERQRLRAEKLLQEWDAKDLPISKDLSSNTQKDP